ncbi:MAG: hypothetical protein ACW99Q_16500, partial [Candidatus Kariarchaeaceae archaeon]
MEDWSAEIKEFYQDLQSERDTELDPNRFIFEEGKLIKLELNNLSISSLPHSIVKINSLEKINLCNNLLTNLPTSLK